MNNFEITTFSSLEEAFDALFGAESQVPQNRADNAKFFVDSDFLSELLSVYNGNFSSDCDFFFHDANGFKSGYEIIYKVNDALRSKYSNLTPQTVAMAFEICPVDNFYLKDKILITPVLLKEVS